MPVAAHKSRTTAACPRLQRGRGNGVATELADGANRRRNGRPGAAKELPGSEVGGMRCVLEIGSPVMCAISVTEWLSPVRQVDRIAVILLATDRDGAGRYLMVPLGESRPIPARRS